MLASEILDKAADKIVECGWCRGVRRPRVCAVNAMAAAVKDGFCHASLALRQHLGLSGRSVADWNDAPGRTQEEVIAKLREAAAAEREAGR